MRHGRVGGLLVGLMVCGVVGMPASAFGSGLAPEPIVPLVAPPPAMSPTDQSLSRLAAEAERKAEEHEAWLKTPEAALSNSIGTVIKVDRRFKPGTLHEGAPRWIKEIRQ